MFERLLDMLLRGWHLLVPFVVVIASQNAGVLRFGKYHRTLEPGFHWKWPLAETVNEQNTCVTTLRLPPQTVTTRDRKVVVAAAIIRYQIQDVKPFITDIWDAYDVLADVTMGAIRNTIGESTFEEVITSPPSTAVMASVRAKVNRYGFKIHEVTFTDLASVRSFRLIQDHPKDLSN